MIGLSRDQSATDKTWVEWVRNLQVAHPYLDDELAQELLQLEAAGFDVICSDLQQGIKCLEEIAAQPEFSSLNDDKYQGATWENMGEGVGLYCVEAMLTEDEIVALRITAKNSQPTDEELSEVYGPHVTAILDGEIAPLVGGPLRRMGHGLGAMEGPVVKAIIWRAQEILSHENFQHFLNQNGIVEDDLSRMMRLLKVPNEREARIEQRNSLSGSRGQNSWGT